MTIFQFPFSITVKLYIGQINIILFVRNINYVIYYTSSTNRIHNVAINLRSWNDLDLTCKLLFTLTGRIVMGSRMAKEGHSGRKFPRLHSKQWQNAWC